MLTGSMARTRATTQAQLTALFNSVDLGDEEIQALGLTSVEDLELLDDAALKEIGIKPIPRRRLLRELKASGYLQESAKEQEQGDNVPVDSTGTT